MPDITPAVDLAAQVQHLEGQLKDHEDLSQQRHAALLERLVVLEQMIAAQPTRFIGTVHLPLVGEWPIALGPVCKP